MSALNVVAAIVMKEDKTVLAAKTRNKSSLKGLWEFPGGKIEPAEEHEDALTREIKEELGVTIERLTFFESTQYVYEWGEVCLHAYLSNGFKGQIQPFVHEKVCWLGREELYDIEWAPADLPLVESLKKCESLWE